MNQIASIQVLRALAALMVVFSHAQADTFDTANNAGLHFAGFHVLPLNAGVDLFFVISGFIMVYSSRRLFAAPRAGVWFMARRIARITPLYWLATGLTLVLLSYEAFKGKSAFPRVPEILASLSFIPFARPLDGLPRPVLPLGWTLNYEMFFYVVFALFVALPRDRAVTAVAVSLGLMVAAGVLVKPESTALAYWSDPIILEFVLGAAIALAFERGFRLKTPLAVILILCGIVFLALDLAHMAPFAPPPGYDPHGFIRFVAAGLPMAAIFAAVVLGGWMLPGGRLIGFLVLLGNASYALYLFHPFAVLMVRKAYTGLGLVPRLGVLPLICAEIPLAILLALGVHMVFEKPVSDWFHGWLRRKYAQRSGVETREKLAPEGQGK
jgi:exopolysaccharide production protein ExoZ